MSEKAEIYPTSSESMSMPWPKCGLEGRRHVWINTVVRAVQIHEVCYTCDYEKLEPWEVVESLPEPHRQATNQKTVQKRSAQPSDEHKSCESEDAPLAAKGINKRLPDLQPVTLDDWHRALGFYKCATCGVPIGNGIPFVWQGRNRWCEECFWNEDGEGAITDELTDFESPKKENPDVNHGRN
jgi:hypothetical protein